jgi:hypothetical protein
MNLTNPEALAAAESAYWAAVTECLLQFHKYAAPDAQEAIFGYKKGVMSRMAQPYLSRGAILSSE